MKKEITLYRSAYYHYEILETIEAGLVLLGTEVKSLRESHVSLIDNYVSIKGGEFWLKGVSIAPYRFGNVYNHEEKRDRKLLLHAVEMRSWRKKLEGKGLTLLALSLYWNKGRVKAKIGLCRGKKLFDKRKEMQKKHKQREIDQALKRL